MKPSLLDLHLFGWDLSLPTYGTLLALAFLAALWVAIRQGRREGVDSGVVTDLWIASLLSGVLGAKLLLYLVDLKDYVANPRLILTTIRSAGVFYGGLIAAILVCLAMVKRRGLDGWVIGDVLAPAIILGQAVGRWGCFAAGCCYGKPTSLPWAVTFTDPRAHEVTGVPLNVGLHPVQLYMSFADLALFLILLAVAARKRFTGQVMLLYLILYSILRGTLEYFRDDPRGFFLGVSTSQWLSIVMGLVALTLYVRRSRSQTGVTPHSGKRTSAGPQTRRKPVPAR